MKIRRLREIINYINDEDLEIFIRNSRNPCGNISLLEQAELTTCASFGESIPCVILNTSDSKEIEIDEEENYIDIISKHNKK